MPEASEKDPVEDKPTIPEGIIPVFLSTATQQIFNVIADSDVTDENPYKFLKKDQLLEDIQTRAAVSDIQPLKQTITVRLSCVLICSKLIQKYPGDELLFVYDYEFKYEQNLYLCVTEEAKELILNVNISDTLSLYHLMYLQPPKDIAKEGQESLEKKTVNLSLQHPYPKNGYVLVVIRRFLKA